MDMNELKQIIDERAQKQIEQAKAAIKSELGAVPQAQIDEAVSKAVAQITVVFGIGYKFSVVSYVGFKRRDF